MKTLLKRLLNFSKKYNTGLIIYTFCFLFAPPLLPNINFVFILALYSFFIIIVKYKNHLKNFLKSKIINKLIKILVLYFIIYFFSIIVNYMFDGQFYYNNYIICLYSLFLCFPVTFICSLYIVFRAEELNLDIDKIIMIFIKAGIIQAILSILTLIFPFVKNVFLNIMYKNTGEQLLLTSWVNSRRFYGFANSMLDLFGFGTGMLAVLPLFYSIKKGNKFLILSPLLLVVPLLNSRSGLVIFIIGLIIWIIYILRRKPIGTVLSYFVLGLFLLFIVIFICYLCTPDTFSWIIRDFTSFIIPNGGTSSKLFSKEFWSLPPIKNLLIGTAHNVSAYSNFAVSGGPHSDVGYINELWKTGIIGSMLIYYVHYYLLKQIYQNKNKLLSIFFGLSIIVFLIKGTIISYNPGSVIIITLSFCSINEIERRLPKIRKFEITKRKKKKPLVSIVVPIYNVEKYLPKCLESLYNQTYEKLEIILVNDGSPDNCKNICNKYLKKDRRAKIIDKENGGLSDARNSGISVANGEYICFVDSDDYVDKKYVQILLEKAIETNSDICACNFKYFDESNNIWDNNNKEECKYSRCDAITDILTANQNTGIMVWNKIYKTSLFLDNDIWFDVGRINEDNFIMYKLYDNANQVYVVNDRLYYYLQRKNSIMGKTFNEKRFDILVALEETKQYFKDKENNFLEQLYCYESLIYITLVNAIIRDNYRGKQRYELFDKIYNNKNKYLKNRYVNLKNKFILVVFGKRGILYSKLLLLHDKIKNK